MFLNPTYSSLQKLCGEVSPEQQELSTMQHQNPRDSAADERQGRQGDAGHCVQIGAWLIRR